MTQLIEDSAASETRTAPPATLRAIIVEDAEMDAELVRVHLQRSGYSVDAQVLDTRDALRDALAQGTPDIVFVDFLLPRFSCREAIEMVKSKDPLIPVIAISGRVPEDTLAELFLVGCDDIVVKDRLNRLPVAVQRVFRLRSLKEESLQAELGRRRTLARYRALIEQAVEGVLIVNVSTGIVVDANNSALSLMGLDRAQVVDADFRELLPPHVLSRLECVLSHCNEAEAPVEFEWDRRTAPEEGVVIGIRAGIVRPPGDVPFMQILLADITQRVRLQEFLKSEKHRLEEEVKRRTEELQRANEELAKANEAKIKFLRNMHHELKTPLNGIIGPCERLLEEDPSPSVRERVPGILHSGRTLAKLIEDMLLINDIDAGIIRFAIDRVQPAMICTLAVSVVREELERKQLRLEVQVDPDCPDVAADAYRLQQVLTNLLQNAAKYTPSNGQVQLQVRRDGEEVQFAVSDTGRGISEEDLPHIFEPFYRSADVTRAAIPGAGIGLALVNRLVHGQDGRIVAESEPGKGTTFRFWLPVFPRQEGTN